MGRNLAPLEQRLYRAIEERVFPGCVVGAIAVDGSEAIVCAGAHTYAPDSPRMGPGSIFDVASVTKVVPTATLALRQIDTARLSLDEPAVRYVPELTGRWADELLVRHLLTHTVDFGLQCSALRELPPVQLLHAIVSAGLRSPPGTTFAVTNATSIVLGLLVERCAGGHSMDTLATREIFEPLGMSDSQFSPPAVHRDRIVPTEVDSWRGGPVRGQVHDESAWQLTKIMSPGSAGLFSTASDLIRFLHVVLSNGAHKGVRLLSSRLMQQVRTNQIAHLGQSTGLGWELNQPRFMGRYAHGTIGKTGFTGCLIACNHQRGRGFVMLSNCTWPSRPADRSKIDQVRRDVADMLL